MKKYKAHNSSASIGVSQGRGPVPGAGELMPPGAGPGKAGMRKIQAGSPDTYMSRKAPSGGTPKGMGYAGDP